MAEGVGTDDVVGVCLDRGPDLLPTMLGILTAGAAYLPLEPTDPPDRSRLMVRTAGARVVVTTDGDRFTGTVVVQPDDPTIATMPTAAPESRTHPDALAYVIFTSGSTGEPKGVGVSHRAIVNRLLWMQETFALAPTDRVLQKTPFSFDVSVWEFFWPLLVGAGLVLARPGGAPRPRLPGRPDRGRDGSPPSTSYRRMLDAFLDEPGLPRRPARPAAVVCSARRCRPDWPNAFTGCCPARAAQPVRPDRGRGRRDLARAARPGERTVPIGRPIANTTRWRSLDAQAGPGADRRAGRAVHRRACSWPAAT